MKYIYIYIYIYITACVCIWIYKYEKGCIHEYFLFIFELFANVKRFTFYMKALSAYLNAWDCIFWIMLNLEFRNSNFDLKFKNKSKIKKINEI